MLMPGILEVGKPMGTKGRKGTQRKPRVEAPSCSQLAINTFGATVACLLLPHSPGMCHLHPLAHIPFLSASCLKRKPAQIWLKNLADASRQQGPECYFCLVRGTPTDLGVWY